MVCKNEACAADYSAAKELYTANEAGGVIALTLEPCAIKDAASRGFENRAYATEGNGTKHEGCWIAPSLNGAPIVPEVKIIPLVNVYFDGITLPFPQDIFTPDGKVEKLEGSI